MTDKTLQTILPGIDYCIWGIYFLTIPHYLNRLILQYDATKFKY